MIAESVKIDVAVSGCDIVTPSSLTVTTAAPVASARMTEPWVWLAAPKPGWKVRSPPSDPNAPCWPLMVKELTGPVTGGRVTVKSPDAPMTRVLFGANIFGVEMCADATSLCTAISPVAVTMPADICPTVEIVLLPASISFVNSVNPAAIVTPASLTVTAACPSAAAMMTEPLALAPLPVPACRIKSPPSYPFAPFAP